jgi:hypothetical protein
MMRVLVATFLTAVLGLTNNGALNASWCQYDYGPGPVMYYYYCPPAPSCWPVPPPTFAKPTPAPPSNGKPALSLPMVIESRVPAKTNGGKVAPVEGSAKDICKIGFWNVSGADAKLIVNGVTYVIPQDRNLTLTLTREFTYQVNGRPAQMERVPNDRTTHEVVIR